MSSILKALKKLEEEQTGRSAGPAAGGGGQFVAPPRARGWNPWLLLAAGVGCGLMLAGGLYLLAGQRRPAPQSAASEQLSGPAGSRPPVAEALPAAPSGALLSAPAERLATAASAARTLASNPRQGDSPAAVVTQAPPHKAVRREPPATIPPRSSLDPAVSGTASPAMSAAPPHGVVADVQVERREIPAPGQQWTAPHLVVSDILPATAGERMAIVNGLPVMAGTMVDAALVREIQADRVVFVIDGKTVAVPLEPAGRDGQNVQPSSPSSSQR